MRRMNRLPAQGTKDRAKLEAMGSPGGTTQHELQDIDGNGGWGTYKNDGRRYANYLGRELKIFGNGRSRRYVIV